MPGWLARRRSPSSSTRGIGLTIAPPPTTGRAARERRSSRKGEAGAAVIGQSETAASASSAASRRVRGRNGWLVAPRAVRRERDDVRRKALLTRRPICQLVDEGVGGYRLDGPGELSYHRGEHGISFLVCEGGAYGAGSRLGVRLALVA